MYFQVKDVQQYQQNKEFIDTAIVPLVYLDFAEDKMVKSSSDVEFLMSLTSFIEQQFKGRLMLIPPFSYTESTRSEQVVPILKKIYKKEDLNTSSLSLAIIIGQTFKKKWMLFGCLQYQLNRWTKM